MATFLSLPAELRIMIYEYLLVFGESEKSRRRFANLLFVSSSFSRPIPLSAQFLRTNKTIHREGRAVLYSQNRFDFIYSGSTLEFLDHIGRENASYIRSVYIALVVRRDGGVYVPTVFKKIRSYCSCLETFIVRPWFSTKAHTVPVPMINAWLRTIPSLQEIIVESRGDLDGEVQTQMESLGWKVSILKNDEPSSTQGRSGQA